MPNNVKNKVVFEGTEEKVKEILYYIKGNKDFIDFNTIIKMPEELNIESGSIGESGMEYICFSILPSYVFGKEAINRMNRINECLKENDILDKMKELGLKYITNFVKYGVTTWYDWCNKYWGTKWNAYNQEKVENGVKFETAWCSVDELIRLLSEKFPEVLIKYSYSMEDIGCQCEKMEIKNGEIKRYGIVDESNDAYEIAFDLWPDERKKYKYINGEWYYKG